LHKPELGRVIAKLNRCTLEVGVKREGILDPSAERKPDNVTRLHRLTSTSRAKQNKEQETGNGQIR
jgi:hypothetical protein